MANYKCYHVHYCNGSGVSIDYFEDNTSKAAIEEKLKDFPHSDLTIEEVESRFYPIEDYDIYSDDEYDDCAIMTQENTNISQPLLSENDDEYIGYIKLICPTCKKPFLRYRPPCNIHQGEELGYCSNCGQKVNLGGKRNETNNN